MQNKSSDVVAIETFKRGMKKVFSDLEKKCSSDEQFVTLLEIMCLMAFEKVRNRNQPRSRYEDSAMISKDKELISKKIWYY